MATRNSRSSRTTVSRPRAIKPKIAENARDDRTSAASSPVESTSDRIAVLARRARAGMNTSTEFREFLAHYVLIAMSLAAGKYAGVAPAPFLFQEKDLNVIRSSGRVVLEAIRNGRIDPNPEAQAFAAQDAARDSTLQTVLSAAALIASREEGQA